MGSLFGKGFVYDSWISRPSSNIGPFNSIAAAPHRVKLVLASISTTRTRAKSDAAATLAADYLARAARYTACVAQSHVSEAALLAWLDRQAGRTAPLLVLFDGQGKQISSEGFAEQLGRLRDSGTQAVVMAIGPPNGWSPTARRRASLVLSFGQITLPHELARVVLAEQVYRALTILAGHPYHSGH